MLVIPSVRRKGHALTRASATSSTASSSSGIKEKEQVLKDSEAKAKSLPTSSKGFKLKRVAKLSATEAGPHPPRRTGTVPARILRKPSPPMAKRGNLVMEGQAPIAERKRVRNIIYARAKGEDEHGLTFLQANKAQKRTRTYYNKEAEDFERWRVENAIGSTRSKTLDRCLAEYFDHLFFEGHNHEKGDKVLAGVVYQRPKLQAGKAGDFPEAKAALKGFRRLAHGASRLPLGKPVMYAMVGESAAVGDLEMSLAIFIGWDGFLRLPSDLVAMTGASLVEPVPSAGVRNWGLLLYPEEISKRSKTGGHDESLMLQDEAFTKLGNILRERKRRAGASGPLWSFGDKEFHASFVRLVKALELPKTTSVYQLRHGAASEAARRCVGEA